MPFLHKLLQGIDDLKDGKEQAYESHWKVLDASVHGGLPQARRHVFITGVLRARKVRTFTWPRALDYAPLGSLLDQHASSSSHPNYPPAVIMSGMQQIWAKRGRPQSETWLIGRKARRTISAKDICPYLSKAGARAGGFYVTNRERMLTTREMLRLQGINPSRLRAPAGVTDRQFAAMVGGAVPVPVLGRVTVQLCKTLGVVTRMARFGKRPRC